jgi:hypothetical protein
MGNNYHFGKSSGGWKFCLNIVKILEAIIDYLDLDEIEVIREVYDIINNSNNLRYEKGNLYHDHHLIHKHKWFLDYTDIFIDHNHIYVQINISVITKSELKLWLRKLAQTNICYISNHEGDKHNIEEFIKFIESKKGFDQISHAKKEKSHCKLFNVERMINHKNKIGNLICSSHEDF